jgi:hypothetical protein
MIIPHRPIEYYREYHVSLWIGQFPSIEDVDAYFTEEYAPDYWRPSPFAVELGLGYYPPEYLEIHFFEEMVPRPLLTLLMEATFSESFIHAALAAARDQGITEALGIALLYNFDYQLKPDWAKTIGPMRFVGAFPFDGGSSRSIYHKVAERAGCCVAAVWLVLQAFREFYSQRRWEQGKEGAATAGEFCAYLKIAQGETTARVIQCLPKRIAAELPKQGDMPTILRHLKIPRSEDVGRVVFALVSFGLMRAHETDSKADFHGLFDFEE